jgi:hypothetical protein
VWPWLALLALLALSLSYTAALLGYNHELLNRHLQALGGLGSCWGFKSAQLVCWELARVHTLAAKLGPRTLPAGVYWQVTMTSLPQRASPQPTWVVAFQTTCRQDKAVWGGQRHGSGCWGSGCWPECRVHASTARAAEPTASRRGRPQQQQQQQKPAEAHTWVKWLVEGE